MSTGGVTRGRTIALATLVAFSSVAAAGKSARKKRGKLLSEATVRFETGSSAIGNISQTSLDKSAGVLRKLSVKNNVLLVGHTDNRGSKRTNRKLSIRRAKAVRDALIKRGVNPHILNILGVGATEPAVRGNSENARDQNRRVEAWLVQQRAVGHVTWIRKSVQARTPAEDASWNQADLDMPVRRMFRVRTKGRSASEVTFRQQTKLHLLEKSMVVIYDSLGKSKVKKRRIADVKIEHGSVFARLAKAEAKPVEVETPAARVRVKSKRTRVSYRRKKKVARVAVYDGDAQVSAKGKTVVVRKNHGTRVEKGKAPEPPKPLPDPPKWDVFETMIAYSGEPVRLFWTQRTKTATVVEVEIAAAGDKRFERPLLHAYGDGKQGKLDRIPEGAYWMRLSARDERGLVGPPGAARPLLVLAQPRWLGKQLEAEGRTIDAPGPGAITVRAPPGMQVALGEGDDAKWNRKAETPVLSPGEHVLPYRIRVNQGERFATGVVHVRVGKAKIAIEKPTATAVEGQSRTEVKFKVTGAKNEPLPGLKFRAHVAPRPLDHLGTLDDNLSGPLEPCACRAGEDAIEAKDEGAGVYSFTFDTPVVEGPAKRLVRLIENDARVAQEFDVPVEAKEVKAQLTEDEETRERGWLLAFRTGAQLVDSDAIAFRPEIELGRRFHLYEFFLLDAAAQAAVFRTRVRLPTSEGRATVIPVQARLAGVFDFGAGGAYLGGSGGVSFVAGAPDPVDAIQVAWGAFVGGFVDAGPGEVALEFVLGPSSLSGTNITADLGPTISVGYRFKL